MPHTPFAILGVHPSASVPEIRAAFRRQAMKHHPDRNLGDPAAAGRFKGVVRAYRAALGRAVHGRSHLDEAPAGPRPDRFECGRCGDRFPFEETPCPRCDVRLWDRSHGPAVQEDTPAVRALIARLEARPDPEATPPWEERIPVPGLLVASGLAGAAMALSIGPVGVALLLGGFSAYVTAVELHRRATTLEL